VGLVPFINLLVLGPYPTVRDRRETYGNVDYAEG